MRSTTLNRLAPDLEALVRAETIAVQAGPRPSADEAVLTEIRQAVLAGQPLGFIYSRPGAEARRRSVAPCGLMFGRANYLVAADRESGRIQTFRLDRMSAVKAGLYLMPQGFAAAIAIAIGSRLYDRIGPRTLVAMGMVLLTASSVWLVFTKQDSGWQFFLPLLAIRGIGFGWSNLPLQTVALSSITGRALPKASSLYNATAQIFSSIGVAVLWPMVRFSQSRPRGSPTVAAAKDLIVVLAPLQAVIWPQFFWGRWPIEVVAALSAWSGQYGGHLPVTPRQP